MTINPPTELTLPKKGWGVEPIEFDRARKERVSLTISLVIFLVGAVLLGVAAPIANGADFSGSQTIGSLLVVAGLVILAFGTITAVMYRNIVQEQYQRLNDTRYPQREKARKLYAQTVLIPWLESVGIQDISDYKSLRMLSGEWVRCVVKHNGVLVKGRIKLSKTKHIKAAIAGEKYLGKTDIKVYIEKYTPVEILNGNE